MQKLVTMLAMLLLPLGAWAQFTLSGTITNAENGEPLPGTNVLLKGSSSVAVADKAGHFRLEDLSQGKYTIQVSFVGFETLEKSVTLSADTQMDFSLQPSVLMTDEVIVNATRANEKSAMTYSEVEKEAIEKQNFGQDLPFLLRQTPSLVVTSDAGAGVGYTGMRIRGSDATRINVTVNGIPLNDSESHGVFWVNMPDFASSVDNIQIQRGVGTSTNGAAAFGASVNIQTTTMNKDAYATIDNSYGSFNTLKNSVKVGSGLINDRFTFDARLSKISSDGYVDRASSDLKSFYLSGAYYGESTLIKLNVFSGKEKTYQSWWGLPESKLEDDRTDNYYTYDNETDNYQQDHYQLIVAQDIAEGLTFNGALHYTYGRGYYEQYREGDEFADYGFAPLTVGGETVETTDLIRRRWLDNDFYGFTSSLNFQPNERLNLTLGGAWNKYDGDHFGEVIWARYAGNSEIRDRYYDNVGEKTDFNTYLKGNYQFTEALNVYLDLQYRQIGYRTYGVDNDQRAIDTGGDFQFFNPKVGVNYQLNTNSMVYTSFSIGHREPVRTDFIDAPEGKMPKAERLENLEAGYKFNNSFLQLTANYYWMDYTDQLVLTGELNDVGSSLRTNVDNSYRMGLELQAAAKVFETLTIGANATLSQNKIANFTEVLYDYTEGAEQYVIENEYTNTDIAYSPNVILGGDVMFRPLKGMELAWIAKYVGKQYLDNTSNEGRVLDAYFVNDARVSYNFKPSFAKEIGLSLQVNNVFNHLYESNGYTFSYIYEELITENYYYPQAGTNFMLSASLKF